MSFHALDVSLDLVRSLRQPVTLLREHDAPLAQQLQRAAASVPLNLAEGRRRSGRDRQHLFRVAAGSAAEVRACLQVAEAWGWMPAEAMAESLALVDRVLAMCWRLCR
jgi:four helix bundle protein